MKFKTKLGTVRENVSQVVYCASSGVKKDYADGGKLTLTAKDGALTATSNNGFVAISKQLFAKGDIDSSVETDGSVTLSAIDFMASIKGFKKDSICTFSFDGKTFTIQDIASVKRKNSLPGTDKDVVMPETEKSFDSDFSVSRESFIDAIGKVYHAVGNEGFRPAFRFWKMEVDTDSLYVVAGSGPSFEIYDLKGKGFISATKKTKLLVSRDHSDVLMKLIAEQDDKTFTVKQKNIAKSDYFSQAVFEFAGATIILLGYDPGKTWPDETIFTQRKNTQHFVISSEEWGIQVYGLMAVGTAELRKANMHHQMTMNFDGANNELLTESTYTLSSTVPCKIKDSDSTRQFCCEADYFLQLITKGEGKENLQFEFIDDNTPSSRTVIVKHNAGDKISDGPFVKTNANGTTGERITLIASSASKK